MESKSYAYLILTINIIFLLFASYMYYTYGGNWYIAIIPFAILTVAILVLKDPIDRWGFGFQQVKIDDKLMKLVEIEYPEVQLYEAKKKEDFRRRMFYFMYGKESYLVSGETEKLDLYHVILFCAPAVIMSMEGKDDEGEDIQRIAAYNHAFPSPKMKFLHSAEYDSEDGVVIFSIEQLMMSLRFPDEYYHIAYHTWCERKIHLNEDFPEVPSEFKTRIPEIFPYSKVSIDNLLGYNMNDYRILSLYAFHKHSEKLGQFFPEFTEKIKQYAYS